MSQKNAKQLRKEDRLKKEDSDVRKKAFMAKVRTLSMKYKVDLVGILDYRRTGVVPGITMVDVKDKYEQMTKQAKEAEGMKKRDKNDVIIKAPGFPKTPKIEV